MGFWKGDNGFLERWQWVFGKVAMMGFGKVTVMVVICCGKVMMVYEKG